MQTKAVIQPRVFIARVVSYLPAKLVHHVARALEAATVNVQKIVVLHTKLITKPPQKLLTATSLVIASREGIPRHCALVELAPVTRLVCDMDDYLVAGVAPR